MSYTRFSILWLLTVVSFFLIIKYVPTIAAKVALIWIINTYPVWLLRKMTYDYERMPAKAHIFVAFLWPITYLFSVLIGLLTYVLMMSEWTFCKVKRIKFTDKLANALYEVPFICKINNIIR